MEKTPYIALYRKYRPKTFADVIGQEHITKVLKNEIIQEKVSHAYLFCGSRGTGKTTCAKILARAVSCENSNDGDPCGVCKSCVAAESSFDITEMDAASNNGVDYIRELREDVVYMPSELKKRVYIIDEVHMLSQGAFNALLKTLEEPPSHVLFILATTEINKIPPTILSRCKRFDFNRIAPDIIAKRLVEICKIEEINLTNEAIMLIARLATGAMRDALSMLELFSRNKEIVDEKQAAEVLGVVGKEPCIKLLEAIGRKNPENALNIIKDSYDKSKDMSVLCSEIGSALRDLLVIKYMSDPEKYIEDSVANLEKLNETAKLFTKERIIYSTEIIEETQNRLQRSGFSRRVVLETAILRLCDPKLTTSTEAINARISELEDKFAQSITVSKTIVGDAKEKVQQSLEIKQEPKEEIKDIKNTENYKNMTCYPEFLEDLKLKDASLYGMLHDGQAILSKENVILYVNPVALFMITTDEQKQKISNSLSKVLGYSVEFIMESKNDGETDEKVSLDNF